MDNLEYCLSLVKSFFKIETTIEDIGYESIFLEREELDVCGRMRVQNIAA